MRKKLAYGTFSMLLMMGISTLGNLSLSAIILRRMSLFDAGIWFTYLGTTTLLSFCDFGFSAALSREIALASYKKCLKIRIDNLYSTVTKILYLFLIIGLFSAIIFYVLVLKKYSAAGQYVTSSYTIFCIGISFRLLANPPLSVIYGLRQVSLQTNFISTSLILGFILSSISLILGFGILGLATSYFISYLFLYVIAKSYVKYFLRQNARFKLSKFILLRVGHVAINWSFMNIGAIMVLQIPSFIIVSVLGPTAFTSFALIRQLCSSILSFSTIIGNAAMPFVSETSGRKDHHTISTLFTYVVLCSTSLALFFAILIFSINHTISQVWLNHPDIFNQKILFIMLLAIILEAHHVSITKICISAGYVKFAKIALVSGVLVTVLSFLLIHFIGLIGAALAILISQLLTNNWFAIYVSFKYIKITAKIYLKILKNLFFLSLVLLAIQIILRATIPTLTLASIFLNGVIYTGCTTIVILVIYLNRA